ncbi:hypothetical protein D3C84_1149330 [compost metagenome]
MLVVCGRVTSTAKPNPWPTMPRTISIEGELKTMFGLNPSSSKILTKYVRLGCTSSRIIGSNARSRNDTCACSAKRCPAGNSA